MVDRVEELLDIKIQNPVLRPAPLSTPLDRHLRGTARPVPVRVVMEDRLQARFQPQCNHRLGDSVGHGGNPENPRPTAMRFRYLHRPHRRRKVAARGHPVPQPIQVVTQIGLDLLDGLPGHSGGTLVPFDALVRLPHQPLRYLKRFIFRTRLAHSSPPRERLVARVNKPQMSRPLRSVPITGPSPLLRAGPPARATSVLDTSQFLLLGTLPLASPPPVTRGCGVAVSAHAFPRFAQKPQIRLTPPACRTPPASQRAPARLIPGSH
jgi:hypothetical protein